MNLFKRLFKKKKFTVFTSVDIPEKRYKEDDTYHYNPVFDQKENTDPNFDCCDDPPPWQNDLDKSIDWDVGKPEEKKERKKK